MRILKGRWHPTIWFVMSLTAAFILALTIASIVLAYQSSLERAYESGLRNELTESLSHLRESSFSETAFCQIRSQGIRLLLVSDSEGRILYEDSNGEPIGLGRIHGRQEEKPENRLRQDADALAELVASRLGVDEGVFFTTDLGEEGDRLDTRQLFLLGRDGDYLFCLCLPVESTNAAVNLAVRFATVVGVFAWLVSVVLLYFVSRALTRPHRIIARVAEKYAEMDFSERCPPAGTRELDELSASVNRMADRLQSNVEHLLRVNDQLQVELDEHNRQEKITRGLIADLSHDLKTPIGIISGYADGLQEGLAATPEQQQRYYSMILRETEHMQSIVAKLLLQSRLDNQAYAIEPETFDLAELLHDVTALFQLEIQRMGLDFRLNVTGPLPVYTDYDSIYQAVVNYVQNAVYHINNGTKIRVSVDPQGQFYRVCVANSSLPIQEEERVKIWTRLYRGDPSRQRHPGGAGLGLSIVRANMERLGLDYGQRNLPDNMVEFWLCVPRAPAEESASE